MVFQQTLWSPIRHQSGHTMNDVILHLLVLGQGVGFKRMKNNLKFEMFLLQFVCTEIEGETIADSETVFWEYQAGWNPRRSFKHSTDRNINISHHIHSGISISLYHQHRTVSAKRIIITDSMSPPHQLLSNPTILNFILLMGGGIGIFNMLGTQLGQLMCPTGPEWTLQKVENNVWPQLQWLCWCWQWSWFGLTLDRVQRAASRNSSRSDNLYRTGKKI